MSAGEPPPKQTSAGFDRLAHVGMAYNAVSQGEHDVYSDAASGHSTSPNLPRGITSRPSSIDLEPSPMSTKMSNASRESHTPLQHPTPGLESLQGAYISNIERLEQSAERLSQSGSDIGEELRKLKLEQKLSESRRASLYSRQNEDDEVFSPPSRQFSYPYGSHASNSIVGTNSIARSGGFSPSAYIASPRSSIRSGSWSHHDSIRGRSNSNGIRLTQRSEPEVVVKETQQLPVFENLTIIPPPPEPPTKILRVINHEESGPDEAGKEPVEGLPPPEGQNHAQPQRPASTDTFQQANDLFEDFDGVHIPSQSAEHSVHDGNEGQDGVEQPPPLKGRPKSEIDLFPDRPKSYMQPIANENMVYYPAPVPMMLNLPQRLSKLPSAPHRDKRRSEMLSDLQPESRKSAPRIPHPFGEEDDEPPVVQQEESSPRRTEKRRTMANMPPQLRASVFFDYPSVHQEVKLKDGSAVATLDSILDASAHAPVSAFTDHPIVGQVGPEVYGRALPSYRASNIPPGSANQKRRSSLNLLRRASNSNMLDGTRPRTSSMMSLGNFGKRRSNPLAGDEAAAASLHSEETPLQVADSNLHLGGVDVDDDEFHEAQEEQEEYADGEGSDDEVIGQPTTLLAELLLRQKQQKQRNRQAATAFPNGMHSTLLEMDAVAQVQKRTREKKHVQLAWEDPHGGYGGLEDEDDEDVPLGMLYPTQKLKPNPRFGRTDEDKPLGLIARRQLEDNETLSQRRARLKGVTPIARNPNADRLASMYTLDLPGFENREQPADSEEVEGETLAERMKRLKTKQHDQVAATTPSRRISGDFASEVMSQFGGLEPEAAKDNTAKPPITNIISPSTIVSPDNNNDTPVEETLGQRRRRLQAEREARSRDVSGDSIVPTTPPAEPDRPPVSKRHSMADILSAHPAAGASSRVVSNSKVPLQPTGPPTHRQTSWARSQQRKFSSNGGGMPMAAGIGVPNPLAYSAVGEKAPLPAGGADARKGDMIDRWRQSVLY